MSRIKLLETVKAGEARPWLEAVEGALGLTPNMTRAMANSPVVLQGWGEFNGTLGKGRLDAALREKIAITVAEANRCDYCLSAHTAIGGLLGIGSEALEQSRSASADDPKEAAALRFAKAVNEERGHVDDAELQAVRAAGFSDGEVAEIVANVAINVFKNYFNSVAEPDIDFPPVVAGAAA